MFTFQAELAEIDGNSGDNNGLLNSQNADDQNISKCEHELQVSFELLFFLLFDGTCIKIMIIIVNTVDNNNKW